jgi:predicted GIY-YIG superfamily endonuclease
MGTVYLIQNNDDNLYKIGVTKGDAKVRLQKLQTGNPTELHIVNIYKCEYPFRMEKMLHIRYMLKHWLNEWYQLDLNDIVHFTDTCKQVEYEINLLKDNIFFAKDLR